MMKIKKYYFKRYFATLTLFFCVLLQSTVQSKELEEVQNDPSLNEPNVADDSKVRNLDNINSTINELYSALQQRYPQVFSLNEENYKISKDRCERENPLPFWCHAHAQFYWHGKVVEQDYSKAHNYLKIAADLGYAGSQTIIGDIYFFGRGVEKDSVKAVEWWTKAADQKHRVAQFKLGVMYEEGNGVKRDYKKAYDLYSKAAQQNHVKAQVNLGSSYSTARGVEKNYKKAFFWFEKAASKGNAQAMSNLAFMYGNGLGVPENTKIGAMWLEKAAKNGHQAAIVALEKWKNQTKKEGGK